MNATSNVGSMSSDVGLARKFARVSSHEVQKSLRLLKQSGWSFSYLRPYFMAS